MNSHFLVTDNAPTHTPANVRDLVESMTNWLIFTMQRLVKHASITIKKFKGKKRDDEYLLNGGKKYYQRRKSTFGKTAN